MKTNLLVNREWDQIFNQHPENMFYNHAFPLFLFTKRLYESLEQTKCKDVLFMSREGQFLKKLFERFCAIKKEYGQNVYDVKTHYFYGSRNSIMMASVDDLEKEKFTSLFKFFSIFMSPKSFMYSIGFSNEQIEMVEKTYGKQINRKSLNFKSSRLFKKLKANQEFIKIYNENRTKQFQALESYFQSFGLDYSKDGLCFVDIGYHGTMQDLIFKFFQEKVSTTGYFIKSRAVQGTKNQKFGLLSDKNNKNLFGARITKHDSFNYEQILRADHGRCLGYSTNPDNYGQPILDQQSADDKIFEKYVKKMQDEIFRKFEEITVKSINSNDDVEKLCVIYYYYLVKNKTPNDYNWILDMQDSHKDDFGFVGYPGKVFGRGIRKFAFKLKDKIFVSKNKGYIKQLTKEINPINKH